MSVRAFTKAVNVDGTEYTREETGMQRSQGQPSEGLGRGIMGFL